MSALLAVLTPIALVNSVSMLPTGIAGVVTSLATRQPYVTAVAFIAGKFVPYVAFGVLLTLGLDAVFDRITQWIRGDPGTVEVGLQLVIGVVMCASGYWVANASTRRTNRPSSPMTPVGTFSVAAGLAIVGLPTALMYFAAIDQILRAELATSRAVQAIVYYNLVLLSPLMSIVVMHRVAGARCEPILSAVARFLEQWGARLFFVGLLVVGVVLVVDAVGWFFGLPLLPSYPLNGTLR